MLLQRHAARVLCAATCALLACDLPTDATQARNAFRGDDISVTLPITPLKFNLGEQLRRTDVGLGKLVDTTTLMVRLPSVSSTVAIDEPFTPHSITLDAMSVSTPLFIPPGEHRYERTLPVRAPRAINGNIVVDVSAGALQLTLNNQLGVPIRTSVSAAGIKDRAGQSVTQTVALAPGTSSLTIPLANLVVVPDSLALHFIFDVNSAGMAVPAHVAAAAFTIAGSLQFQANAIEARGPAHVEHHATHALRAFDDIDQTALLRGIMWRGAKLHAKIGNSTGAAIMIDSIVFESSSSGANRASFRNIRIAAGSNALATIPASDLLNALLLPLAAGQQRSLGIKAFMQFENGTVRRGQNVGVDWHIEAPLNIELPADGVKLDTRAHLSVPGVVSGSASTVRSAALELRMSNTTALDCEVAVTLAATPADTSAFDPGAAANRVAMPVIRVPARAQAALQTIEINAQQLELLRAGKLSVALSMKVRANGPVVLNREDLIQIVPVVRVKMNRGGVK